MNQECVVDCTQNNWVAKEMLINCKCGAKAKIYSRDNINPPELFKVYCQCQNKDCNRSFTTMVAFFEELRPSDLDSLDQVKNLLDLLPHSEVKKLLEDQIKKAA